MARAKGTDHSVQVFEALRKVLSPLRGNCLMLLYWKPELLDGISPELKKQMQGKTRFNFRKLNLSCLLS